MLRSPERFSTPLNTPQRKSLHDQNSGFLTKKRKKSREIPA
ncbi:hypothetical protein HMPREF0201_02316 [Cedecea davisae DSM 4568]|uniref:Uncharacterized protein n=1 Tax=Cedecea davisae DSM 4568 TaxID=566551 RepID=S3IU94_9ENTR|nr:hypothetical protein HMPREF0201_02316 [Cedecea davisae DSM 4568]